MLTNSTKRVTGSGYTLHWLKKRVLQTTLFSLFTLLFILGCTGRPSIIGDWTTETGMSADIKLKFNNDGTFELEPQGMGSKTVIQGNFTLKENRLNLKFDQVKLSGNDPFSGMAESMMSSQLPEDSNLTIAWKTEDEIILDGSGFLKGRFKRIKD